MHLYIIVSRLRCVSCGCSFTFCEQIARTTKVLLVSCIIYGKRDVTDQLREQKQVLLFTLNHSQSFSKQIKKKDSKIKLLKDGASPTLFYLNTPHTISFFLLSILSIVIIRNVWQRYHAINPQFLSIICIIYDMSNTETATSCTPC